MGCGNQHLARPGGGLSSSPAPQAQQAAAPGPRRRRRQRPHQRGGAAGCPFPRDRSSAV